MARASWVTVMGAVAVPSTPRASRNKGPRLKQGFVDCFRRADMARQLYSGSNSLMTASTERMSPARRSPSALFCWMRPPEIGVKADQVADAWWLGGAGDWGGIV